MNLVDDDMLGVKKKSSAVIFAIIALCTFLSGMLYCVNLFGVSALNQMFACFVFIMAILALEYFTWQSFFVNLGSSFRKNIDKITLIKLLALSLFCAFLLEALTLMGSYTATPLVLNDWSFLRIAVFFVFAYGVLLLVHINLKENPMTFLRSSFHRFDSKLFKQLIVALLLSALLSLLFAFIMLQVEGLYIASSFMFAFASFATIFLSVILRKQLAAHPEWLFLTASLLFGLFLVFVPPAVTNLSWDDQIHFRNALELSYLVSPEYSAADATLFNPVLEDGDIVRPSGTSWTQHQIEEYHSLLDTGHSVESYYAVDGVVSSMITYSSFGYIPSALGLWLARLFDLPFHFIFQIGKLANLLAYCLVSFAAIRIIPIKKVLLCAVAVLPTNLFLAASYSYDPWLTAFLFLAIALFVRELCEGDRKLTPRIWLVLIVVFFVALGPKAIYFLLIGLLILLPKKKFTSVKHRKRFILSVIVLSFLVLMSYALPFVTSGADSATDLRGGETVSSPGQIMFMLSNPLAFIEILTSFLLETYLTIEASSGFTISFAYFGVLNEYLPWAISLPLVYLLFVAITDTSPLSRKICKKNTVILTLFLSFATAILIVTALYISFTPVGHDTVLGCQPRYLLPLLFPFLALCLNFKFVNLYKRNDYNQVCILLACVPIVACCWVLVASNYFAG